MNVSKVHKYDVFLSYSHQDRDHAAGLNRLLEEKGFVSSFADLDDSHPSSEATIFEALYDSFVCLLLIGSEKQSPWWHDCIGAAINERVTKSRGEFRVVSVVFTALEKLETLDYLSLPFASEDMIVWEDSLNDADKLHELILLIRGARKQPKFFADPELRAWIKLRAKNALRVDWATLWCQYNSRFDDLAELPKFETNQCTETGTKLHLRVFYGGTEGIVESQNGFCSTRNMNHPFRLITDPVRWVSNVIRFSSEKLYDPLISNDIYSKLKLTCAEAKQPLEHFDHTTPTIQLHKRVSITSLDDRSIKLEPQVTGAWVVLNCCYENPPSSASLSSFEQDDRGWQLATPQGSNLKQIFHLDYDDWLKAFLDGNHQTQPWQGIEDYLNLQFLVRACGVSPESYSGNKERIDLIIVRDGMAHAEHALQIYENLKEERAVYSTWSIGTFDEFDAGKASASRYPCSVRMKETRVAVIGCGVAGRAIAAALVGSSVGVNQMNRRTEGGKRVSALLGLPYSSSTVPLGIIGQKTCCGLIGKYVQDLHTAKLNTQGSVGNCSCQYREFVPCEERDAETAEPTVSDKTVDVNAPGNSEFEEGGSTFSRWQVVHFCLPVPEERIQ